MGGKRRPILAPPEAAAVLDRVSKAALIDLLWQRLGLRRTDDWPRRLAEALAPILAQRGDRWPSCLDPPEESYSSWAEELNPVLDAQAAPSMGPTPAERAAAKHAAAEVKALVPTSSAPAEDASCHICSHARHEPGGCQVIQFYARGPTDPPGNQRCFCGMVSTPEPTQADEDYVQELIGRGAVEAKPPPPPKPPKPLPPSPRPMRPREVEGPSVQPMSGNEDDVL